MIADANGPRAMAALVWGATAKVAAAIGAIGTVGAAWIAAGLPTPATQTFVRDEVAKVMVRIESMAADTNRQIATLSNSALGLQRESIVARRARLRFELGANAGGAPRDPAQRATLRRRADEIRDELADLEQSDSEIRTRIEKLRSP